MLYILLNRKKQAPWQNDYERIYQKLLTIPYKVLNDRSELDKLGKDDYLWIQHFSDIDAPETRACKARKIAQVNGTAINPYIGAVDKEQEKIEYNEILDIALVFDGVIARAMKKVYPRVDFWSVGFPIPEINNVGEKKKQICVSGRLDIYKNVNLNIWLTENLRRKGCKVIFCYPDKDVQEELVKIYKPEKFDNLEFRRCKKKEWLEVAKESEFYLLTSLDDVCSVSMWEAYYSGCYLLVPNIDNGIIRYPDYVSCRFNAFDRTALEYLVENKLPQKVNTKYIQPRECVKRLEEYLNEKSL